MKSNPSLRGHEVVTRDQKSVKKKGKLLPPPSPLRQKGVLDMVDDWVSLVKNDGNDIKSDVEVQPFAEDIGVGGIDKVLLLLAGHRQVRLAEAVALAGLHLHDDQRPAVFGDDVDFLVLVAPVAIQDLVAFLDEIIDGELLAHLA